MRYYLLRMSLLQQERLPIRQVADALSPERHREEYLSYLFNNRIDFEYRKKTFVYVPIGVEKVGYKHLQIGRIGRLIDTTENAPSESGFEEISRVSWRAANVIIDISDHSDGQKIAFQYHPNVGKPVPIAVHLINHINKRNPDSGWFIEINVIKEKQSFWNVTQKYKGEITNAEFTYVTPNILGIRSKLNEELKNAREQHNAMSVTEALHNPKGNLDLTGDKIKDAVNYISKGGGKSKLKVGRETVYDSEKDGKLMEVSDDEPLTKDNPSTWNRIATWLFK